MNDNGEKFIIGLTGLVGSGCTTLSKALEQKGFERVSISSFIKDKFVELHNEKEPTLQSFGPDWRAELQEIGNRGRKGEYCDGGDSKDHNSYWIDLALKNVKSNNIVIDGLRNAGEVQALRKRYAQFWLVAVYADYDTRWIRTKEHDQYEKELIFIRDNDRDSDEDEPFGQNVQHCVYDADFVLNNSDKIEPPRAVSSVLATRLERELPGMKGEEFRKPMQVEVFMATAVSQSNASQCLQRKVGALIVDVENKIPLSVGYNDNPVGMESCFSLYNGLCYKNMVMESKLEKLVPFFCPECGKKYDDISPPWKCDGQKSDSSQCRCNFKHKFFPSRNMEICTAIHAEERAIRSLGGRSAEGCTLYVNTFPCFQCCRYIKDAGITKVVYVEAYPATEAVEFLKSNRIDIKPFEGYKPRVFNRVFTQIK